MKHLYSFLTCPDKLRLLTATAFVVVFLCGCEKDPEPLYNHGTITGYIELYSLSYETINGNNVRIIAHGPYGNMSTVSDPQGKYTLSGLGNGTYEIEFQKEDFGTFRRPGIQIFGTDTLSLSVALYKKANCKMPRLTTVESPGHILTNIPSGNYEEMQIRVFLSDTEKVSFKNYIYTEMASFSQDEYGRIFMNYNTNPYYVNEGGPVFKSGQKRYMIAYVCNENDPGYFNEYYGLIIYSTVDEGQHSQVFGNN